MLSQLVAPVRSFATRQAFLASPTRGRAFASLYSTTVTKMAPFAVVVEAEIEPDRMAEFLEMIKTNAENSRKEPGCIRFGTYSPLCSELCDPLAQLSCLATNSANC